MATVKRGLRGIKTIAGLSDRRRTRSAAGALLELSVLAREKERLGHELAGAERRRNEIQNRLADIAEKEARLKNFIKDPPQIQNIAPAKTAHEREVFKGVKTKEINY